MNPGDLLLVKGQGLISDSIKKITRSQYSHVAIVVKENEVIEAKGFTKTGYEGIDEYKGIADLYTCDKLTEQQREKIVQYATKRVGTHYDYLLLLWEFVRYVFGLALPFRKSSRRICSTLASDAYRSVGVDLWPGIMYPAPDDIPKSTLLRKAGSI